MGGGLSGKPAKDPSPKGRNDMILKNCIRLVSLAPGGPATSQVKGDQEDDLGFVSVVVELTSASHTRQIGARSDSLPSPSRSMREALHRCLL